MIAKASRTLLFLIFFGYVGYVHSGTTSTEETKATEKTETAEEAKSTEDSELAGNFEAGEERYKESCVNCHGAAGKGAASYPKISGNEISYTKSKLETYRDGIKIGPNSFLMIMNAKTLTDKEIADLAAYLKDATS